MTLSKCQLGAKGGQDVEHFGQPWRLRVTLSLFAVLALLPVTKSMVHCTVDAYALQLQKHNDRCRSFGRTRHNNVLSNAAAVTVTQRGRIVVRIRTGNGQLNSRPLPESESELGISKKQGIAFGYTSSDPTSKGIVSTLTDWINRFFTIVTSTGSESKDGFDGQRKTNASMSLHECDRRLNQPPQSAIELFKRIREEYVTRNYLWTGDLDVALYDPHCRFTDPTLSFHGVDQFVRNVQNLRPVLDAFMDEKNHRRRRSDLLSIELVEDKHYIQTRWNMVGELSRFPWKPRIDVVGRTKFWYDPNLFLVNVYDEEWEIPAYQALLHLVTPTKSGR